ncbi:hypothetical protein GYH30_037360 [Glycine max]|nr:hypothetical protein GYH30_037360 [Glycine max]
MVAPCVKILVAIPNKAVHVYLEFHISDTRMPRILVNRSSTNYGWALGNIRMAT